MIEETREQKVAKVTAQLRAWIDVIKAVGEAIKLAGSIPSGHLYAQLMGHGIDLDKYTLIIDSLKQAGVVKESNHLLTWIGKP